MGEVKDEMEVLRKQLIAKTLIISGIPEQQVEKFCDLGKNIQGLQQQLGLTHLDVDHVRRVGRPAAGSNRMIEL